MVKGIKIIDDSTYNEIVYMLKESKKEMHVILSKLEESKDVKYAKMMTSYNISNLNRVLDKLECKK